MIAIVGFAGWPLGLMHADDRFTFIGPSVCFDKELQHNDDTVRSNSGLTFKISHE